jgi:hypothetical protein
MFRVMTSEAFMADHPRSAEFAGRRFESQSAEAAAARAVTPGNSRASGHSRTAPPAAETRLTSDESARNRREQSPSADNNRHLRT